MPKTPFALSALSIYLLFIGLANAAAGCTLDGVKLDCGNGSDLSIVTALASPETADLLADPLLHLDRFERPIDIEKFRSSLEKNWRAVNRAEVRQRRKMHRRQISAAQFEEWAQSYDYASRNYSAAIYLYRTLIWHGKTGKAAPKG